LERGVQSAIGADGLFDERDDVILPADIGPHEQGASNPADLVSLGNAAAETITFAPSLANARAVALPMPEVPPVMRTVLFSKVFIVGLNVAKIDFLAKVASPHETENRTFSSRF
jgi:hypothetical protein